MSRRVALGFLLLLAVMASGCRRSQMPKLHPVKGRVVRGSQPVFQALVKLDPIEPGEVEVSSSGVTDEQGNFEIKTIEIRTNKVSPGVPAGMYKLSVMLPVDANQGGGGTYEGSSVTIQPGENTLPLIDVSLRK